MTNRSNKSSTRVTFAYLQDHMPENSVCALHDVRLRDYLVWRLRGWVKPKFCPMAIGEFASGFQLTDKGRNADVHPRRPAADATALC